MGLDYAAARQMMVESQLRTNGITDRRLLAAMGDVPREAFLPKAKRPFAYSDESIEIWPGPPPRYLIAPLALAQLIQLASVAAGDHVLDIGCATGYATAVLARLGGSVIGLECEPELAGFARNALRAYGASNTEIITGPLTEGAPERGPYDVILVNGSVAEVPRWLGAQLKDGGRLVAIVANGAAPGPGKAYLCAKVGGEVSGRPVFDASARPLPGFARAPLFSF